MGNIAIDVAGIESADLMALGECVRAAARGPFFPDTEMHTLIGADRAEVMRISDDWPASLGRPDADWIVQNILANLTGYPINEPQQWGAFIRLTEEGVRQLTSRYVALRT